MNVKFVTEVLSVTEIMLRVYIYICVCVCVHVKVAFFEALYDLDTCYIMCFSVLNEINCIVEDGVVL